MVQIDFRWMKDAGKVNELLREYPREYPKREVKSVVLVPNDPTGYFMTITYELTM